ncbi:MAG: hypothetical protein K0U98_05975 [Deltaproteobacteria bacterium]|nr:hypothetical protein [Deltaproteobacteria bacterium]
MKTPLTLPGNTAFEDTYERNQGNDGLPEIESRAILDDFDHLLERALQTGNPSLLLSWWTALLAHWESEPEILSRGMWIDLADLVERRLSSADLERPQRSRWEHLLTCLRSILLVVNQDYSDLLGEPKGMDVGFWKHLVAEAWRAEGASEDEESSDYRTAIALLHAQLFDAEAHLRSENGAMASEIERSRGPAPEVMRPPAELGNDAEPAEWERWVDVSMAWVRTLQRLPEDCEFVDFVARLAEDLEVAPEESERLLRHWAVRCPLTRAQLERWWGTLWSEEDPLELPPADAPRGPELEILVGGAIGVGKTSLLFALEDAEAQVGDKAATSCVFPITPTQDPDTGDRPRLNPFQHGEDPIVVAERKRWHDRIGHTQHPQIRARLGDGFLSFNFVDVPGEYFDGDHQWLDAWFGSHPPSAVLLVMRLNEEGRLELTDRENRLYRELLDRGECRGRRIGFVINAIDQAGLREQDVLFVSGRPIRLSSSGSVCSADHEALARSLPGLRRVEEDLAVLATPLARDGGGTSLVSAAQAAAGQQPVSMHYTCLLAGAEVEPLRRASASTLWASLATDLTRQTRTARQEWLLHHFHRAVEEDRDEIERLDLETGVVIRRLEDLIRHGTAFQDWASGSSLLDDLRFENKGDFEAALETFVESEMRKSYENTLETAAAAASELAICVLRALGVPLSPFDLRRPIRREPQWIERLNETVDYPLPLPEPRTLKVHMQLGVLETGSLIVDGPPDDAARGFLAAVNPPGEALLEWQSSDASLRQALQQLSCADPKSPARRFFFDFRELDVFKLAASAANHDGRRPPWAELIDLFSELAKLFGKLERAKAAWSDRGTAWMRQRFARKVLTRNNEPNSEAVREAGKALARRMPLLSREEGHKEREEALDKCRLPGVTASDVRDKDKRGILIGRLRDLGMAEDEMNKLEVKLPWEKDDLSSSAASEEALSRFPSGQDSMAEKYLEALLTECQLYLEQSAWLRKTEIEQFPDLVRPELRSTWVPDGKSARQRLGSFLDAVKAVCGNEGLW